MIRCVCGGKLTVTDTRYGDNCIFRKRVCQACGQDSFAIEYEVEKNAEFMKEWNNSSRWRKDSKKAYVLADSTSAGESGLAGDGTPEEKGKGTGGKGDFRLEPEREIN